jgi:hypothetical protein
MHNTVMQPYMYYNDISSLQRRFGLATSIHDLVP